MLKPVQCPSNPNVMCQNISGHVDKRIEALCTTLVELQKAFLDHAAITVVRILDDAMWQYYTWLDGMTN